VQVRWACRFSVLSLWHPRKRPCQFSVLHAYCTCGNVLVLLAERVTPSWNGLASSPCYAARCTPRGKALPFLLAERLAPAGAT
jgi:hypothetical protein